MFEYAQRLIKRHCMILNGKLHQEIMIQFKFVPQTKALGELVMDNTADFPCLDVVMFITNRWVEDRVN